MDQTSLFERISTQLASVLEGAFEHTALTRRQHFIDHPTQRPTAAQVEDVISRYANQNFLIAGAANLVPGPLGMLAVIPELTLIIRNQIQMIYDLGVAHGKEAHLTPTTLLGVFASVLGGGAISLASVQGGRLLIRRASLRVIQKIIQWLGGKITQRLLKQLIAKWLPIAGAVIIATWARQSTVELGRRASDLLKHDIQHSDDELREDELP